jgi:NADPH2:quinone reductase
MRQVQIDTYGGPEVLRLVEVPDPRPGPGQIVVRTAAAGITFVETQVRAGRPPWPGPGPALPVVLGNGVAGEVVATGAGVDASLLGQRVVTATGGFGGYADHVVVNVADPVPIPDGLEPGEAVALLADGRTALALARAAALTPADRVLVTAAAGGVGSLLVQLARVAGVKQVVAAAGSARKLALARDLGADVAVDYTQAGWADVVRAATGGLDVVFDGVGGQIGRAALGLVAPGGRYLRYGAASGSMTDLSDSAQREVTVIAGQSVVRSPEDNRELVVQALAAAASGRLRPVIGQTFPLSRASDAHAAIEARATIGKTLLIPE